MSQQARTSRTPAGPTSSERLDTDVVAFIDRLKQSLDPEAFREPDALVRFREEARSAVEELTRLQQACFHIVAAQWYND